MNQPISRPAAILIAVGEPGLREEARRAVAAAGRDCVLEQEPITRHAWKRAPMLVIDNDTAHDCLAAGVSRRPGVIVVTVGEPAVSDWRTATAVGAQSVVVLPEQAPELVRALGDYPGARAAHGMVVSVVGATGGVGVSIFAAALALGGAASGARALLVDGDPAGGGIDMVLGLEREPGLRWPGLVLESGRISAEALHSALPGAPNLSVLSCEPIGNRSPARIPPLGATAVESILRAGRDAGDLVICDVARTPGAVREIMLDAADVVVLLVTARLRSAMAATVVAAQLRAHHAREGLVVRGPAPGGLRADTIAAGLEMPLWAVMRSDPNLALHLERGGLRLRRRSPLRAAAESVLTAAHEPTPALVS